MNTLQSKYKVIGITGGVGAGKSTILSYLEQKYHAVVIRADEAAARLEEPGQLCYESIVREFGESFLEADGRLDRNKLAQEVFARPERLQKLNEIVHPAVREWIRNEIRKEQNQRITAIEAALLLESGYDQFCDEVWYIYVPEEERIRRLMDSRGYSEEKCRQIMANQLPESEFRRKCQFLIDNSLQDVQNTYGQIDKIIEQWGKE